MFSELLSEDDNKKLTTWTLKHDKPLFIMGYDGCGKTYWAKELLKRYHIITIGSEFIKYSKDITEYLTSSLLKKDIFMMISSENQYKALMIDDIQLFSQNDKTTMSKIYKFVQTLNYKQHPVIFVCNHSVDKCIKSMKLNSYVIEIKYNLLHYKRIFQQKLGTTHKLTELIKHTKNLNTLLSTTNTFNTVLNDRTDPINDTINDIISNKYSVNDLLRKCASEYSIISLNLIENIGLFTKDIKRSNLLSIYQSICLDDYIQYKYIQNNIDMQLLIYYSCVSPLYMIKQMNLMNQPFTIKYNTYISRSMIQIHNQNIIGSHSTLYLNLLKDIYKFLCCLNSDIKLNDIKHKIQMNKLDIKVLEKQIKVFNYYYNKRFDKKKFLGICKLIIS